VTVFVVDDDVRARIADLRAFAEQREHWYIPGKTGVPGLDRRHVVHAGDVQACFSWTVRPDNGRVIRHLTASVRAWHEGNRNAYPLDSAVWTLAHLLGFTGATASDKGLVRERSPTWAVGINEDEGCVIVQETVTN
jgi:hypothetical protein